MIEWKQKILQKTLIYTIQNQNTITTFIKWAHTPPNGLIIKRLLEPIIDGTYRKAGNILL